MLWLLAHGLDSELTIVEALAFSPVIYVAQVIPLFYFGFGAREAASLWILAGAAVMPEAAAIALSLAVGLCNLIVGLPGAWYWSKYLSPGRRPGVE